jgi:ribose 5-phosphate isomerase A
MQKQAAAQAAANLLEDGMLVGLGSGSTAELTVTAIGKRIAEGLKITGVSTSEKTARLAESLRIPLTTLDAVATLDIAIDGADEIELGTLNLIKGGGGNSLREKLVALASPRFIIVADESKLVPQLGAKTSVPVDVVPFGWQSTARRLEQAGAKPTLRKEASGNPYLTDNGNYILDCAFGPIPSPRELQQHLDGIVGVVEHGLFLNMATQAIIGASDGVTILVRG